jgi:ribosomal protein L16 Arg81 hydroxylase
MAEYAARVLAAGSTNDFYFTARSNNIEREGLARLQRDVEPPLEFFRARPRQRSQSFWFGPKGSITGTHHDPTNILFCQVYGEKRVQLSPPFDPAMLGLSDGFYHRAPGDPAAYPELADATVLEVQLSAGDALFIPALWWHRVEALSVSISYSLLHFKQQNTFPGYRP